MKILYRLFDNGGLCDIYLPIKLTIGTIFEHEYGFYKVIEFEYNGFNCERL